MSRFVGKKLIGFMKVEKASRSDDVRNAVTNEEATLVVFAVATLNDTKSSDLFIYLFSALSFIQLVVIYRS